MDSVFTLSGYENKTLSDDYTYTNTYETYGFQLGSEDFDYSSNDDSSTTEIGGKYIRYFKISLNTEKIVLLMDKYGVDVEDNNMEFVYTLTPTLDAKSITENSVTLASSINYYNTDPNYAVACHIYRSNTEDGNYEKITDNSINCLSDDGYVDTGLNSNTTYYKAIVEGGTIYSFPLSVTTIKNGSSNISNVTTNTNNENNDNIENPKAGTSLSIIAVSLLLIISVCIMIYTKNRSVF